MSEDGRVTIETGLDMSGLKKDIEGLKQVFKSSGMEASLNTLKSAVKEVDKSVDELEKSTGKTARTLKSDLSGASRGASQDLDKIEKASKDASKELNTLGKTGSDVASLLKKGFAAIGVTKVLGWLKDGIAGVAEATGSYANVLRGASTLFGEVQVDMGQLGADMLKLSNDVKINSDELGAALYSALSAGIQPTEDMNEALGFLESSAKTAKGGFTDVNTVVGATASTLNAYGLAVEEADRIQGILMQTQNKGITTVGELGESLSQVVPTAAAFGVEFEQVGAALATMTASGTKTAQATTSLNSMLAELGKDGQVAAKNLKAAADAAGLGEVNFQGLIDEGYSIADILLVMQQYAESNGQTLLDMFGSVEAGRAALQLASGDAEKFKVNLEAMGNTSGLVDSAFETMTTGVDEFRLAIDNAKKKIGLEFAPGIDEVAGKLADMINKLTGNKTAADDLETALQNVSGATDAYRTAQELAKTATDETTQAMLDQSAIAYRSSMDDMMNTYDKTLGSIMQTEAALRLLEDQKATSENSLDQLARNLGVTRSELADLRAEGKMSWGDKDWFDVAAASLTRINGRIAELSVSLDTMHGQVNSFEYDTAMAVRKGLIDIESIKLANYDLYKAIDKVNSGLDEGKIAEEEFLSIYSDDGDILKARIDTLTWERNQVEEGSEAYYKLTGQIEAVTAAYKKLNKEAGKASGKKGSSGNSGSSGSEDGGSGGSGSSDSVVVPGISVSSSSAKSTLDKINDIYDSVNAQLSAVSREEELFGATAETSARKVNILKQGMIDVSAYGSEAESELEAFAFVLDILNSKAPETKDFIDDMCDYFKDLDGFATDAANTFGNTLVAGFKALGKEVGNSFQKIKDLEEDIADANDDLVDKQDELLDAQEELNDAKARGNEDDIEAAEKKIASLEAEIEGINAVIKAKGDEKKSVESGETAWKAFGRTALSALAQVLYGVGAQLAAEAVLRAIALDWAGAGIATAGSVAAIAAGVGLDAAAGAFEKGGIVPQKAGVPSTGDKHIARVNPGELILNEAQQNNLADQIRAARMSMDDVTSTPLGRSIIVNLAGSHIYGLDEPAVGRAIYENIRTLASEGVL